MGERRNPQIDRQLRKLEDRRNQSSNELLRKFGDTLAELEGYQCHRGQDAVTFWLIERYAWTPETVRSISRSDLLFLIGEKLHEVAGASQNHPT